MWKALFLAVFVSIVILGESVSLRVLGSERKEDTPDFKILHQNRSLIRFSSLTCSKVTPNQKFTISGAFEVALSQKIDDGNVTLTVKYSGSILVNHTILLTALFKPENGCEDKPSFPLVKGKTHTFKIGSVLPENISPGTYQVGIEGRTSRNELLFFIKATLVKMPEAIESAPKALKISSIAASDTMPSSSCAINLSIHAIIMMVAIPLAGL